MVSHAFACKAAIRHCVPCDIDFGLIEGQRASVRQTQLTGRPEVRIDPQNEAGVLLLTVMPSNSFSIGPTIFHFLIGAARSCLILGRTPNIHAVCGGRHRSRVFEVRPQNGMFSSISTRSLPRKAKIGCGAAGCRYRGRMTGPLFTYHVQVRTRLSYASSTS